MTSRPSRDRFALSPDKRNTSSQKSGRRASSGFLHDSKRGPSSSHQTEMIWGMHSVRAILEHRPERVLRLCLTLNASCKLREAGVTFPVAPESVTPKELDHMLGSGAIHQGICVFLEKKEDVTLEDVWDQGPIVILDQVTDPHNVGAILRSCAAFSVRALVVTERHSPSERSVAWKAASGGGEFVPYVEVVNLARALDLLKTQGFWVLGLDSDATLCLEEANVIDTSKMALVLGAEGRGLRRLTRDHCDLLVRLGLPGPLQSLNVSNAAALALYALHQRQGTK